MGKILYLCWKAFIKGNYWLYFGVSLFIGLPFIEGLSIFLDLPYQTGNFHYEAVIIFLSIWFTLLQISESVNMKVNEKLYNFWNIFWGLVGFGIALFLMR
jgi:hypothetical protein